MLVPNQRAVVIFLPFEQLSVETGKARSLEQARDCRLQVLLGASSVASFHVLRAIRLAYPSIGSPASLEMKRAKLETRVGIAFGDARYVMARLAALGDGWDEREGGPESNVSL
jgi:hypothetical protein